MSGNRIFAYAGALLFLIGGAWSRADELRKAPLDKDGRFWVYRNSGSPLFFVPYGFMPEELAQDYMRMDVKWKQNPYTGPARATSNDVKAQPEGENTCISFTVKWHSPGWCGVAFISGPDMPQPWWGETSDGRVTYFDLRDLPKKKLVFHARGQTGQERLQVKMGILGDKKFGDSMPYPPETQWLKLGTGWTKYELDLSKFTPQHLAKICNGFTFVLAQAQQGDPYASATTVYLDDIYYE